jgi:hypothetical protein
VNGANADCSTSAGATILGAPYIPDAGSGSYYLAGGSFSSTVVNNVELIDVLWYNTGLVVTTTTLQAITTGTISDRDRAGTANGEGVRAAILVTTATTNAGAVTTITLNYTDQDGNTGAVATMSSFPATAVAGTFVPFQFPAGDRGIRAITNASGGGITLGTTLAAGAISLVLYRVLARQPNLVANVGGQIVPPNQYAYPGVRLYNNSCLWPNYLASATTATNLFGSIWIVEK